MVEEGMSMIVKATIMILIVLSTIFLLASNVWPKVQDAFKLTEEKGNEYDTGQDASNAQKTSLITNPFVIEPGITVKKTYGLDSWSRGGKTVKYIVLHHTAGSDFQSAYDTLKKNGFSAHYIIDKDGIIYYLVDESRMAATTAMFNSESIGIEIVNEGTPNHDYTKQQYTSLNTLIKSIVSRWKIPFDNEHIVGHFQVPSSCMGGKFDPSPNFIWNKICMNLGNCLVNHPTSWQVCQQLCIDSKWTATNIVASNIA